MSTPQLSRRSGPDRLLELTGVTLVVVALLVAAVGVGTLILWSDAVGLTPGVAGTLVFGLLTVVAVVAVAVGVRRHGRGRRP